MISVYLITKEQYQVGGESLGGEKCKLRRERTGSDLREEEGQEREGARPRSKVGSGRGILVRIKNY